MLQMIPALAFMALVQGTAVPAFTDADVRRAVACADGMSGQCAEPAERAAAIGCLAATGPSDDEAVTECLASITDRCVGSRGVGQPEMRERVILICAATSLAATREAIDDWLVRAPSFAPEGNVVQYRALRETVPGRASADAAIYGQTAIEQAGTRNGVWASFGRFLAAERRKYP